MKKDNTNQPKTVKMSTRKGNTVLLEDVMNKATGEVILRQIADNEERAHHYTLMIGAFFHQLALAHKNGENKVTFYINDFLE